MANGQVVKVVSNGYYECLKCHRERGYKGGFKEVSPNPLQTLDQFQMTNPGQKDLKGKDWFETMEDAGKPVPEDLEYLRYDQIRPGPQVGTSLFLFCLRFAQGLRGTPGADSARPRFPLTVTYHGCHESHLSEMPTIHPELGCWMGRLTGYRRATKPNR